MSKSNTKKEEQLYSQDDPPDHDETEVDDDAKQIEILKSLISNLEGESEVKTVKPKVVQEKKEDNFMAKLKQIFKKKRLNEEVYIESDSKLEEDTVSEQFIDVIVTSINKTYFKLKTATGNCVTFMDNIFLFAPCINIDNQVFMTVNEEEVRRKMKESIALISYEKNMRNKYKTNCDDYYKLCNKGSPSYDETTCKQLREECEDESSDEESSRIVPERKPLPVYPFRRPETSKPDNFSIPTESIVRSSFFKPTQSPPTLNNDLPPVVTQTSTVRTVTTTKPPAVSSVTQSTPQTSSLRDLIKAEAVKKDFSPDDIIEKLKKSIKSNDISDILS
ncbi:hypothetical protein NBO_8g0039 [Nosema bombycis CQ1]|uniref:Uncharacterized protein n=1 Tax=Nosema bombycis (strain CQ1 / CVCC 102059) TaxID=578461 RepID=R0MLP9_NOSB1|nr:hypothetical protein NBO_8g0039 [Nosema bombycis CQ1]|eukprot:EOB15175.1 hypothetical protein NBO_8g0039 [Nosema bombycis CQ1]